MTNRLLALAAAAALALPAAAQPTSSPEGGTKPAAGDQPTKQTPPPAPKVVDVYGTLNVNLQYTLQTNVHARWAVSTDSTNVGVRGSVFAIPGWGATYQCETSANVDGINASGICNRNSRVGVVTPAGTLFYGNWDTPFKAANYGTKAQDPFGNTDVFGFNALLGSPGFNYRSSGWVTTTSAAAAPAAGSSIHGFDVRANNAVGFHSASFSGLSVKLEGSTNEFANTSGSLAPKLYGAVVNYDAGPLAVYAAYERHEDAQALATINPSTNRAFGATAANPANLPSNAWAWRVGAGYELQTPFGATTLSGMFDQLMYNQDGAPAGAVQEFKRTAFYVGLAHRIGAHELRARYSQAFEGSCSLIGGAACSTAGYGAKDYAVGYAYFLARQTQVFAFWTTIRNDANAQYTFSIGGASAVAGATTKGSDPLAGGIGIRHAFSM